MIISYSDEYDILCVDLYDKKDVEYISKITNKMVSKGYFDNKMIQQHWKLIKR